MRSVSLLCPLNAAAMAENSDGLTEAEHKRNEEAKYKKKILTDPSNWLRQRARRDS